MELEPFRLESECTFVFLYMDGNDEISEIIISRCNSNSDENMIGYQSEIHVKSY